MLYKLKIFFIILLVPLLGCGRGAPRIEPLSQDSVVLAFGDSLTAGTGAMQRESYPSILQEIIRCKVINGGVPGEVSQEGLKRLPALLDKHEPNLVVLCHGGNDMLQGKDNETTIKNLEEMIGLVKGRGMDVILIGVPRPGLFISTAGFYEDIAEKHNVLYEGKIMKEIMSTPSLKSDRVHPNASGCRKIAEAVAALISQR